jgi:hypothetical protein
MNWFKFAKDFSDRNAINSKIRYLQGLKETIESNSKVVFQSGKTVKESNYKIITSAKITSYPSLHEVLIKADSMILDSPWKFGEMCDEAVAKIEGLLITLKKEREDFTRGGDKIKFRKGWF